MTAGRPRTNKRKIHPVLRELNNERLIRKISIEKMSDLMGYNESRLSGWERGKTSPTLRKLADWCEALGFKLTLEKIQNYDAGSVKIAERLTRLSRARRGKHVVQPKDDCGGPVVGIEVD